MLMFPFLTPLLLACSLYCLLVGFWKRFASKDKRRRNDRASITGKLAKKGDNTMHCN
jgi:hypothetical protein